MEQVDFFKFREIYFEIRIFEDIFVISLKQFTIRIIPL